MKDERSFKVVLKNVYPLINIEELKQTIYSKNYAVTNIWNVRRRTTKEPLPMFFVELNQQ